MTENQLGDITRRAVEERWDSERLQAEVPTLVVDGVDLDELERALQELADCRELAGDQTELSSDVALALLDLGDVLREMAQLEVAGTAYLEALTHYQQLVADQPEFDSNVAVELNSLGIVLLRLGHPQAAEEACRSSLACFRVLAAHEFDEYIPNVAEALNNLGNSLHELRQFGASEAAYREALAINRMLAEHLPETYTPAVAGTLRNLGEALRELGQLEAAEAACREALASYRVLSVNRPEAYTSDLGETLDYLGNVLRDLGQTEGAEAAYREARGALSTRTFDYPDGRKTYVSVWSRQTGSDDPWTPLPQVSEPVRGSYGGRDGKLIVPAHTELAIELQTSDPDDYVDLTCLEDIRAVPIRKLEATEGILEDVTMLARLTDLHELILGWSPHLEDEHLHLISNLPGLRRLHIASPHFTDRGLQHLSALQQLRELEIQAPGITVSGLDALRRALTGCTITPEAPNVRVLRFPADRRVGGLSQVAPWSFWEYIADAQGDVAVERGEATMLSVNGEDASLTLKFLMALQPTDLDRLELGDRDISLQDVEFIAHLSGLREISVDEDALTDEVRQALRTRLPRCSFGSELGWERG